MAMRSAAKFGAPFLNKSTVLVAGSHIVVKIVAHAETARK